MTWRGEENIYVACEGYVYFATIGGAYVTHVKIGFTTGRPEARIRDLQTGYPFPISLFGHMAGCLAQEAELHDVLAADRVSGEWFEWTDYGARLVEVELRTAVLA